MGNEAFDVHGWNFGKDSKIFLNETLDQGPDYDLPPAYGASASEIACIHELVLVFFYKVSPCDTPYL
jgi:hypothetical protein